MWLTHDNARAARVHRPDQRCQMRGRRRHTCLRLESADELETETAREIGPAVVIADERHAVQRGELRFPFLELAVKAGQKCLSVGFVDRRALRVDAGQTFQDIGSDDLGVLRIEPIVRIAAAVGVPVARPDGEAAHFEGGNPERRVDVAGRAAADVAAGLGEQPVEPEIEVEPDPHHGLGALHARQVLRLGLVLLGIEAWRNKTRDGHSVAADCFGEASQIARRGNDGEALLRLRRSAEDNQGDEEDMHQGRSKFRAVTLRMRAPSCDLSHLGRCQMLFGMRQWMFFSVSEIAPTRQSIAMLAKPYASRRAIFLSFSRNLIMAMEASSIALLRFASLTWVT